MKIDALIPARAGSKRIPNKNFNLLNGKPLIWWTVKAAQEAGIFREVVISSNFFEISTWDVGCTTINRPAELATDTSLDVEWIKHYLDNCESKPDLFMILRPTSPFRTAETILRAWDLWKRSGSEIDSLRAVSRVNQHPGKMWTIKNDRLIPLMNYPAVDGHDSWNRPTQSLPEVWVQNASLEIGQTRHVLTRNTVSGWKIAPFYTHGFEGFDLNTLDDWALAEYYIREGIVKL